MEGEVDPNAVTQEARSGEHKKNFYLKAVHKNQDQTNGDEKQSSNQGRDKVAKQKYKVQIKHLSTFISLWWPVYFSLLWFVGGAAS